MQGTSIAKSCTLRMEGIRKKGRMGVWKISRPEGAMADSITRSSRHSDLIIPAWHKQTTREEVAERRGLISPIVKEFAGGKNHTCAKTFALGV